jgi:hypothetical protein
MKNKPDDQQLFIVNNILPFHTIYIEHLYILAGVCILFKNGKKKQFRRV